MSLETETRTNEAKNYRTTTNCNTQVGVPCKTHLRLESVTIRFNCFRIGSSLTASIPENCVGVFFYRKTIKNLRFHALIAVLELGSMLHTLRFFLPFSSTSSFFFFRFSRCSSSEELERNIKKKDRGSTLTTKCKELHQEVLDTWQF